VPVSMNIFGLMKFIKEGRPVGLLLDQHKSKRQLEVSLIKGTLKIPEAPIYIARERGISILPVFSYIEDGKVVVRISPPVLPENDIISSLQKLFQKYIQKGIGDFVWAYSGLSD